MWNAIFDSLRAVWDWFAGLLAAFGEGVIAIIAAMLPSQVQDSLGDSASAFGFALSAANAWVPLDLAVTLASSWIAFVLGYLAVKICIKLIP